MTGERELVVLPGNIWSSEGWPGAFAFNHDQDVSILRHLAGPDDWPRTLLEDVELSFMTQAGHIVFSEPDEDTNHGPLNVMLPDESIVLLDEGRARPIRSPSSELDQEVLYRVEDGERVVLRRTVLPRVGI